MWDQPRSAGSNDGRGKPTAVIGNEISTVAISDQPRSAHNDDGRGKSTAEERFPWG
jgi:hypothetical protein